MVGVRRAFPILSFQTCALTEKKTDSLTSYLNSGHNSRRDWWILFAFPNFQWILIPFIIAVVFGRELAAGLRIGAKQKVL